MMNLAVFATICNQLHSCVYELLNQAVMLMQPVNMLFTELLTSPFDSAYAIEFFQSSFYFLFLFPTSTVSCVSEHMLGLTTDFVREVFVKGQFKRKSQRQIPSLKPQQLETKLPNSRVMTK